jgi:hypothetical protein
MAKAKKTTKSKSEPSITSNSVSDPAQVAAAAAAFVAHRVSTTAASSKEETKTESSSFKNLKDSLNKPHAQSIGGLLDKTGAPGQKKSAVPFGDGRQVKHNQTFGADVNKMSVPRRTGG